MQPFHILYFRQSILRRAETVEGDLLEVIEQLAQITALRVRGLVSDAMATDERASQGAPATEERNEGGVER